MADQDGLPLLFLAPKQATFQLERQLLADPALSGYSRLHILSFERLAGFVFEHLGRSLPTMLNEEGRVMVLRALLTRHHNHLRIYRASSRLPGFAIHLSQILRELQQHHLDPTRLETLATKVGSAQRLDDKLHDLALLLRAYLDWVKAQNLEDGDRFLDLAADALRGRSVASDPADRWMFESLWLDGFAQMTPQERHLLLALIPRSQRATLAFCLEREPESDPAWYSPWTLLAQTYRQCRTDIEALSGVSMETRVEILPRMARASRFATSPVLQFLEAHWAGQGPSKEAPPSPPHPSLRVLACPHPEGEAVAAAREIRRHVRAGGRYRDVAVLVRQLDRYHDVVRRVFSRYDIPFFLDRREGVAHHPLAELTRSALRTIAYHWRHEDWFAALKSGLVREPEWRVDHLENLALEFGWEGPVWHQDLRTPNPDNSGTDWNEVRRRLVAPFLRLSRVAGANPNGPRLAEAIREFWEALEVGRTLESWGRADPALGAPADPAPSVHATVWDQMQAWLDNVGLAFAEETMALADWLPVLSAGLDGLTIGVIPPVLDHVLVGAIDRSRNPDLTCAIVLGVNESVFPAAPRSHVLLTDADRERMEEAGARFGPGPRAQLGHERFYGYIACTRARERVILTYAREDAEGHVLNPSPFLGQLQRLFPWLRVESVPLNRSWAESDHATELVPPLLLNHARPSDRQQADLAELARLPEFTPLLERMRHLHPANQRAELDPALAEQLYGPRLATSVSRVEDFADCPFRFFVAAGLGVEERKTFELDIRQQGSFQHEILAEFHKEVAASGRRWRQLEPEEARALIGVIAGRLIEHFEHGMMKAGGHNRFLAETHTLSLQRLVGALIEWMGQYDLDPAAVEIAFGMGAEPTALPAWELDLDRGHSLALRGRIDRVDLLVDPSGDRALCVVMDYKSSSRKPDRGTLFHGVEQQLPAYLNVLRHIPNPKAVFGVAHVIPAGVFYVPLKGRYESADNRRDAFRDPEKPDKAAFTHQGLFDVAYVRRLDNRAGEQRGDQFPYRLTKNGEPYANQFCALPSAEFQSVLDHQRQTLIGFGRQMYQGVVRIDPWKRGDEKACDYCEFQSICRIDPWEHKYRGLSAPDPVPRPDSARSTRARKTGRQP